MGPVCAAKVARGVDVGLGGLHAAVHPHRALAVQAEKVGPLPPARLHPRGGDQEVAAYGFDSICKYRVMH